MRALSEEISIEARVALSAAAEMRLNGWRNRAHALETELETMRIDNGILVSRCVDLKAKVGRQAEQIERLERSRTELA